MGREHGKMENMKTFLNPIGYVSVTFVWIYIAAMRKGRYISAKPSMYPRTIIFRFLILFQFNCSVGLRAPHISRYEIWGQRLGIAATAVHIYVFSIQACRWKQSNNSKSILNSERHLLGSLTNCVPEVYKKSVNVVCVCACMGMHECVHMVLDMQLSSQSVSKKV